MRFLSRYRARRTAKRHAGAKTAAKRHGKHGRTYSVKNPDFKIIGIAAASGIAVLVAGVFAADKIEAVRKYWYAIPAATMIGSAFLLKKMPTVAIGMAGAAGLLLYMGYQGQQTASKPAAGFDPGAGYWLQGARLGPQPRRDSGLYERSNAGAFLGQAAIAQLASQSGALLGSDATAQIRTQSGGTLAAVSAGRMYSDAMGLQT